MFALFNKKKPAVLTSPVIGTSIHLEDVPDPVFAAKMMGDGIAFRFDDDTVFAPCDATVILLPKTRHAVGLNFQGTEILIHVGLDTVNLNGKGFTCCVQIGDRVRRGDLLLKLDRQFMKEKNIDLTCPMIITSTSAEVCTAAVGNVDLNSVVIELR